MPEEQPEPEIVAIYKNGCHPSAWANFPFDRRDIRLRCDLPSNTRLATLKPPGSSDTGHFHGLGTEDSKEDTLIVSIELNLLPTACEPATKSDRLNRSTIGIMVKKNGGRNDKASVVGRKFWSDGKTRKPEPVVLEYRYRECSVENKVVYPSRIVLKAISHFRHLASCFCH